jgi:hypothetical protein
MPRFSCTRVLLMCVAVGATTAAAFAQGPAPAPPACPDGEDKLTTFTQGYGKPAQSMVLRVQANSDEISNATVTVTAQDGTATTTAFEPDYYVDQIKVIVVAPASGSSFTVAFAWDQDAGSAAACHGTDIYTLPLLPVDAVVGTPTAKRLQGRWRMRYRPISYKGKRDKSTWTLTPKCDYFGCDTRMRSTGHLRGVVKLRPDDSYRFEVTDHAAGSCTVTKTAQSLITGQIISRRTTTIRNAWRPRTRINLRVKAQQDGRALTVTGLYWVHGIPTSRALNAGCRAYNSYEHVDGQRLSG